MASQQIFMHIGTISGNEELQVLIDEVASARIRYISLAHRLTNRQAQYKPTPDT